MAKLKMNFSQNPDVYIKKQARIRNQRPRIYKVLNHLFLNFFKVENLLHCEISKIGKDYINKPSRQATYLRYLTYPKSIFCLYDPLFSASRSNFFFMKS